MTDLKKAAEEIFVESIDACQDCHDCNSVEYPDDETFEDDYCSACEMVVSIDPVSLDWTIDNYQYLQRIVGMVILPIPVDVEDIIDAVLEYRELSS